MIVHREVREESEAFAVCRALDENGFVVCGVFEDGGGLWHVYGQAARMQFMQSIADRIDERAEFLLNKRGDRRADGVDGRWNG